MNNIRKLVSKKKKRYTDDGFNLDLAYIPVIPENRTTKGTMNGHEGRDRFIAMGIPLGGHGGGVPELVVRGEAVLK